MQRADEGAHAGAADDVHRDAQLAGRAQQAEVREAARAAAAQHQPHALADQAAREAGKVGRAAQVVVAAGVGVGAPAQRIGAGDAAPRALHHHGCRRLDIGGGKLRQHRRLPRLAAVLVHHHQDAVGLAHAASRPGPGMGVGDVDQQRLRALLAAEPAEQALVGFGIVEAAVGDGLADRIVHRLGVEQAHRAQPRVDRLQVAAETAHVHVGRRRHQGQGARPQDRRLRLAQAGEQTADHDLAELHERVRIAAQQFHQGLARQADHHAVAHGPHAGRMLLVGQDGGLAEALQGRDFLQRPLRHAALVAIGAQAADRDHVQRVDLAALPVEQFAGVQHPQRAVGGEIREHVRRQTAEDGGAGEGGGDVGGDGWHRQEIRNCGKSSGRPAGSGRS